MACIRKTTIFSVLFVALYTVFFYVEANECYSHSGCYGLKYCCRREYPKDNVCKDSCIGEYCYYESHCATGESCCSSKKCATNCIGEPCSYSGDCATGEYCDFDDYKCKTEDCNTVIKGLAGWIVAVIVIGVIVVIVIPIAVVVFCCCCGAAAASRRPARVGVIATQPTTTETTVIASNHHQQQQQYPAQQGQPMYFSYSQHPQPYPNQPPPHQPQGTVYPPEASGSPMAMTPLTDANQELKLAQQA